MRNIFIVVLLIAAMIAGCVAIPAPDPGLTPPPFKYVTATPESVPPTPPPTAIAYAPLFGAGWVSRSFDPYLNGWAYVEQIRKNDSSLIESVRQAIPIGFVPYNLRENGEGLVGDGHGTRYGVIDYEDNAYVFPLVGWAGERGWSQTVHLDAGVYGIKADGRWDVDPALWRNDIYNAGVRAYIAREGGGQRIACERQAFPAPSGEYDDGVLLCVFYVGAPGDFTFTCAVSVNFANAGGSVWLNACGLAEDLDGDHWSPGMPTL